MTHAGIECFLALCRCKTVSRAAQALYITQSSLSTRLKTLETELGGPLFHRKKGCREITLTLAGKEFYGLALQYESLLTQMQQVCRRQTCDLRVSSFNSIGTYLLPAVYERILQKYPQIRLEIQDMELDAAVRSIQNGATDIAFTAGKAADGLLRQTPVCSEPMVLIASARNSYQEPVTAQQLILPDEIYIEWTNSFARWHQQIWGNAQPQIRISMMAHLGQFIEQEQRWAIVPVSVADGLAKDCRICRLSTAFPLPRRDISCLTCADREHDHAISAFFTCLQEVIAEHPEISPVTM